MCSILGDSQAQGRSHGFALAPGESEVFVAGCYRVTIRAQREAVRQKLLDIGVSLPPDSRQDKPQTVSSLAADSTDHRPSGLIIQLGQDEMLVVGKDLDLSFAVDGSAEELAEISRAQEGRYEIGRWQPGRILNGDERLGLVPTDRFGMVRIKLLRVRRQRLV